MSRTSFKAVTSAYIFWLCGLLLCLSVACNRTTGSPDQRYPLAGEVVSFDRSAELLVVNHGEIPGYMPAMVMPFKVKGSALWQDLKKGDRIRGTLVVSGRESWLENISVTGKAARASDPRDAEIRSLPREGDAVPDFSLINQDRRKISLGQYRGKVLLITFIYTRCPLPDYCPLMSSNFAEIDKALRQQPALYARTHLLSVSFDSKYDTPAVLRSYGAAYTERYETETFDHWEFASGSDEELKAITRFFGLQYETNGDQISHSLVTAIISPEGKIFRIHPFNDWKPEQILAELREIKL